jgi:predicted nuclease with TOPRIM domain
MQIPENPDNNDIRAALIELGEDNNNIRAALIELGEDNNNIRTALIEFRDEFKQDVRALADQVEKLDGKVEKLEYKFDTYQKGTDGMVRMATTIIIGTASVVVLSNLSPAVSALVTALSAANQAGR